MATQETEGLIPLMEAVTAAEKGTGLSLRDVQSLLGLEELSCFEAAKLRFTRALLRLNISPTFTPKIGLGHPMLIDGMTVRWLEELHFPYLRLSAFWILPDDLRMVDFTPDMVKAIEGLRIQGRALGENLSSHGRNVVDNSKRCDIIQIAMTLVLRNIGIMFDQIVKSERNYSQQFLIDIEN